MPGKRPPRPPRERPRLASWREGPAGGRVHHVPWWMWGHAPLISSCVAPLPLLVCPSYHSFCKRVTPCHALLLSSASCSPFHILPVALARAPHFVIITPVFSARACAASECLESPDIEPQKLLPPLFLRLYKMWGCNLCKGQCFLPCTAALVAWRQRAGQSQPGMVISPCMASACIAAFHYRYIQPSVRLCVRMKRKSPSAASRRACA